MTLTFLEPCDRLKPFIKAIWAFESPVGLPVSDVSIAAPNGSPKLIVSRTNSIVASVDGSVQSNRDHSVYLVGIRDIPVRLHTRSGKTSFVGFEFRPHGAYPILKVPLIELTNLLLPVAQILRDWHSLPEVVTGLGSLREQVEMIQELLLRELERACPTNPLVEYCVEVLDRTNGLLSISDLVQEVGYSKRYLEMLFRQHVGVSPKTLASIFRFQRFYKKWAQGQSYDSLKEELYSYYYDQAHFANEFKRMTGFYPQRFVHDIPNPFGRQLSQR
jgi:AraC-like DNA-binding protein